MGRRWLLGFFIRFVVIGFWGFFEADVWVEVFVFLVVTDDG